MSDESVSSLEQRIEQLEKQVQTLQESGFLYKTIVENLPLGIQVFDRKGYSYLVNRSQKELLGLPDQQEGIGQFNVLKDPYARETGADKNYQKVYQGETRRHEFEFDLGKEENQWDTRSDTRIFEEYIFPIRAGEQVNYAVAVLKDKTQEKKAEQEVKESRDFLNTIFQSIQDGISVLNTDLTIRYVNPVMEQWYAAHVPLAGKKCHVCYHNSDSPCNPCPSLRAIQSGQAEYDVTPGYPDENAPVQWLELYSYPIIDSESGKVTGVVEFVRDITERIKARDELASQRQRLSNIIQATDAGTWEWNVQTGEVIFNERWARIVGYSLDELSPTNIDTWMKLAHDDDLEKSSQLLKEHFRGERDYYECEARMRHKDGSYRWVLDRGKVVSWAKDGSPLWMFGTHHDITERKQHEAEIEKLNEELTHLADALRRSNMKLSRAKSQSEENEALLMAALENSQAGIAIAEVPSGKLKFVNQAGLMIRNKNYDELAEGVDAEEYVNSWQILHFDGTPYEKDEVPLARAVLYGETVSKEFIVRRDDNEDRYVLANAAPVTGKEGRQIAAIVVFLDITDRKMTQFALQRRHEELQTAEEELKASNEELFDINQRLEDQKKDLEEAKEKAEESDRLKSAFLANMSHEIRTPMNGIMGFSQLLSQKDYPREKQQKFLGIIHQRTSHLLRIINDIVDLSKIEASQMKLEYQQYSLNEACRDLQKHYQDQVNKDPEKQLQIKVHPGLDYQDSWIYSDPTRFRQIMDNLLSNAIKFTCRGVVEFGYRLTDENTLLFYVKDTGIGIAPNDQARIFDRFSQASEGTSRTHEGTGLGLTISRNLVDLLGGQMWVESQKDQGSVFYFTLPYLKEEGLEWEKATYDEEEPQWGDKTFLLIEDDFTSRQYMKEILKPTGVKLFWSETGRQALKLFREKPSFDLVLLDLKLPDVDGFEVARQIRLSDTETPILAQTAYAMSGDAQKSIHAGCNAYISKPIDRKALVDKIDQLLNRDK
jgi:PAS domain S-box-containing protein